MAGFKKMQEKPQDDLALEFGPFETVHRWKRVVGCDEFVGSRRSKHTMVAYKDALYAFGGDNGKSMLNDLLRFDLKEACWIRALSMGTPPAPRYHHSAVVHNNSMFIFGGYTGDILANSNLTNKNDLFEYKFSNGQWAQWKFNGMEPVPRSAHGAAVYKDKLWIYAGYDGNARLNDMWTIDLVSDTKQWELVEQKGQCPPTCCNFPVAVARESMFVFSGQSGANITNTLYRFHFDTQTWHRICTEHLLVSANSAPARRYGHVMLHHHRHLYVFGGAADNTLPCETYRFDLDTHMWSMIACSQNSTVPSGRLFHAGAVIEDAMYIFGGTTDNNVRSGALFRFQFSTYPRCTLHEDFGKLLHSAEMSDVTCLIGKNETRVDSHQALLAARSTYLRTKIIEARRKMATQDDAENGGKVTIKIPEASCEAFRMVLNYIYTDRIDPTEKDESPASPRTVLLVVEVLVLACMLNVTRLRGLCARYLRHKLCVANVLHALHSAHKAELHNIKECCLRFIVKDYNYTPIVMSEEFEEMDKGLMVEIVRRRQQQLQKSASDPDEDIKGHTLEQDMRIFLMETGAELSDVKLAAGKKSWPAHISVLSARSGYFEALFRSFSPPDRTVKLKICHAQPSESAVDSLLRYIYFGDTNMPTEDSLYLYQAPNFFAFTNNRLQVLCKQNLQSNVGPHNVIQILKAAHSTNSQHIKDYALDMIVYHFANVAKQEAIRTLPQTLLVDIINAIADNRKPNRIQEAPQSSHNNRASSPDD